ncbi:S4 domain-containing protein [Aneurinibacillus thermoaerophilus]|uniref:S4 domain-containing protein n=1 Tax=Aneurinibacillus thermoaerophilus TaxID=143495 RepID=A0A1G8EKT1_ANETH|nr:S4 domain-containing protein [Aneurinibacillus thermoaerophilus]SDH70563.1 S4 domain-containing protein [Aneurinibacillus thermoaerophilus]
MNILAVLTQTGMCPTHGEARRMVFQGAVKVDKELTNNPDLRLQDGIYEVSVGIKKNCILKICGGQLASFFPRKAGR